MSNDDKAEARDRMIAEMNASFSSTWKRPVDIRNDGMDEPPDPYSGFRNGWSG